MEINPMLVLSIPLEMLRGAADIKKTALVCF